MSRLFYHVMQDNVGNLLFDVSGTMRLAGTGTAATIYGDEALTIPIANPMTNHPSFGSFKCFLGAGDYDFYMAKSGYTFETLTGVQGHGTMAQQDAHAVAITGGSIIGLTTLANSLGDSYLYALRVGSSTALTQQGQLEVGGPARFEHLTASPIAMLMHHKAVQNGMELRNVGSDSAAFASIGFFNMAGTSVGAILTSATATAYGTTSDARLKHDVTAMTGALDVVRALNPVAFRWKLDESEGHGLLAHEVAEVVDGVITEKDALDEDGNVQPQQIDYSKLVPYLIGAVKELTQQVEMLQAQLAVAGA